MLNDAWNLTSEEYKKQFSTSEGFNKKYGMHPASKFQVAGLNLVNKISNNRGKILTGVALASIIGCWIYQQSNKQIDCNE